MAEFCFTASSTLWCSDVGARLSGNPKQPTVHLHSCCSHTLSGYYGVMTNYFLYFFLFSYFLVIFIILFDFYFYLFIYLFLLCLQWCEERRWHVLGRGQRTVALLQWWLTSMRAVYSTGGWSLKDIWPVSIPYLLHISLMSSHLMLFSNINLYK